MPSYLQDLTVDIYALKFLALSTRRYEEQKKVIERQLIFLKYANKNDIVTSKLQEAGELNVRAENEFISILVKKIHCGSNVGLKKVVRKDLSHIIQVDVIDGRWKG